MDLTPVERETLTQLQRGIAIEASPFLQYPLPEADVVRLLQRAQEGGLIRRFGGVFDSRKLGYRSMLCGVAVTEKKLEAVAGVICQHAGVTHCYERRPLAGEQDYPLLWFTIAMLEEQFDAGMDALRAQWPSVKFLALPALQRFKIDVVFDLRKGVSDKSGSKPYCPASDSDNGHRAVLTDRERTLVRLVGGDIPFTAHPFDTIVQKVGMSVMDVLGILRRWKAQGVLRRIAPVLYHRKAGFTANGMCVWQVSGDVGPFGQRMAARPEVTHCYQRPRLPVFPFDLYAMIHAGSRDALYRKFEKISGDCGLRGGVLLFSTREFKKSSMQYFERDK